LTTNRRVLPGDLVCLPAVDPLLCPPEEKPEREAENTLRQLLFIEQLIERGVKDIRESHVIEFHRLAVEGIFSCGGRYRTVTRSVELKGGSVSHIPPEPALVPGLMLETIDTLNERLSAGLTQKRTVDRVAVVIGAAAFALWRLNWVHPFAGGNGRTARAVCCLILSIDFGRPIPGTPSLPTIISQRRQQYVDALRQADRAEIEGREDLNLMEMLVSSATIEQLRQAIDSAMARLP
jgi:Fic family protein